MNGNKIFFKQIYIFLILFIFCKFEMNIKEQILTYKKINLQSRNDSYYHFIPKSLLNTSIKIEVKENSFKEDYINHIISYYKDGQFDERKQLAQSLTGTTFMWLNENQIKDDFYLSIECAKKPCYYSINIIPRNYPELNLGEQYAYYITEDNKNSIFLININLTRFNNSDANNTILIYARGSKYLNVSLNNTQPTYKKEGYLAYIMNIKEIGEYKYYFKVSGKEGALINVGVLLYGGELNNTLENLILENGIEYTGLLYKELLNKNCFKFPKDKNMEMIVVGYEKFLNPYKIINEKNDNYTIKCITFKDFTEEYIELNQFFYTVQFIDNFTDDGQGMIKYPKILPDVDYYIKFDVGNIMVINQLEPEDNYIYLSFYGYAQGDVKLYSYVCETYPLCQINPEIVNQSTPIKKFDKSFSYSFTKEEIGKNVSSISKIQHLLFIICEKALYDNVCDIDFFSYSNITKMPISSGIIYQRKDDVNNIYPFLYSVIKPDIYGYLFIAIKKYSGNISINIENCENCKYFDYKNDKLIYKYFDYKNDNTLINDLKIIIKANNDSIYGIEQYQKNGTFFLNNSYFFFDKRNYLLNFKNANTVNISYFYNPYYPPNYAAFYPINCDISVEKFFRYTSKEKIEDKYNSISERYNFYQELFNYKNTENLTEFGYIIKANKKKSKCLFSAGLYRLDNNISEENLGILLNYNISNPFIFEKKYNDSILFSYPFGSNYSNFSINIYNKKKNKYNIEFYINHEEINKSLQINSTTQILMEKEDWETICNDTKQLCILSFLIQSKKLKNSKIDILISSSDYKLVDESFPLLYTIIEVVLLIFIIGGVHLIIKCRNKNKNDDNDIGNLNIELETKHLI